MSLFERDPTRRPHCPLKGDGESFVFLGGPERIRRAAWSYNEPFASSAELKDRVAFMPHLFRIEEHTVA